MAITFGQASIPREVFRTVRRRLPRRQVLPIRGNPHISDLEKITAKFILPLHEEMFCTESMFMLRLRKKSFPCGSYLYKDAK